MPTNGFSINPLKVKLLAGEQKATESSTVTWEHCQRGRCFSRNPDPLDRPAGRVRRTGGTQLTSTTWTGVGFLSSASLQGDLYDGYPGK